MSRSSAGDTGWPRRREGDEGVAPLLAPLLDLGPDNGCVGPASLYADVTFASHIAALDAVLCELLGPLVAGDSKVTSAAGVHISSTSKSRS